MNAIIRISLVILFVSVVLHPGALVSASLIFEKGAEESVNRNRAIEENRRTVQPRHIKVATVQMHSAHDLKENVSTIIDHMKNLAGQGVRVAVFPEAVTTGYYKDEINRYTEQEILAAEQQIAEASRQYDIYAIVGTPYFEEGIRYNMALVIDNKGNIIFRQPKINLVGGDRPWSEPGNRLGIFKIDGEWASVVVCHDSRYPELVRLPVIKGARVIFYISSESDITLEYKIEPYRSQVVARAVENNVYIVHANTPQRAVPFEGSHGQSRIVDPNGVLLKESPIFGEDILIEVLDLSTASGGTAVKSLDADFLNSWWMEGLDLVQVIE